MCDQYNVASQKSGDILHCFAENTQQDDGGLPMSIDNDASAGGVTADVDAAAATAEHKEESFVDSYALPSSAVPMSDHHSSNGESLLRSAATQLHATDEAKTEMNSEAGRQEHSKQISDSTGIIYYILCLICCLSSYIFLAIQEFAGTFLIIVTQFTQFILVD